MPLSVGRHQARWRAFSPARSSRLRVAVEGVPAGQLPEIAQSRSFYKRKCSTRPAAACPVVMPTIFGAGVGGPSLSKETWAGTGS